MIYVDTKKVVAWVMIVFMSSAAMRAEDMTAALRQEVAGRDNPIVRPETHPILYNMINEQAEKIDIAMPTAVKLYNARSQLVLDSGQVATHIEYMGVWVDVLGDLRICKEAINDLTYEEIKSLVTVALAEKACNIPMKLLGTWLVSFAASCYGVYELNDYYKLRLGVAMFGDDRSLKNRTDSIKFFMALLTLPASLITKIASNQTQKTIDKTAAQVIGNKNVIAAIQARKRLEESYVESGLFERLGKALHLKPICNTIFYPIRAFNDEERIQYLSV